MRNVLIAVTLTLVCIDAFAVEPWTPTDAELRLLPPYCTAKFKEPSSSPTYRQWQNALGPDFVHTHHYCAGLNFLNRYYRSRTPQDKKFNLQGARSNMDYMVSHASPAYALMPDVYFTLATIEDLEGRPGHAIDNLKKATASRPTFVRAWLALVEHYVAAGEKAQALAAVTEALHHNPRSTQLREKYVALGGTMPFPEAVEKPVEPAASQSATPTVGPSEIASPDSGTGRERAPSGNAAQPAATEARPNPYCRFCPD